MSKHTETPWEAETYPALEGNWNIRGQQGEVCKPFCPKEGSKEHIAITSNMFDKAQANAEHIVKCVNAHETLVQFVKLSVDMDYENRKDWQEEIFESLGLDEKGNEK